MTGTSLRIVFSGEILPGGEESVRSVTFWDGYETIHIDRPSLGQADELCELQQEIARLHNRQSKLASSAEATDARSTT